MKHVLKHCKDIFDDQLVVAHFFNARGEQLEKTCLGMLRSIVYQLVLRDNAVRSRFDQRFREKEMMHEAGMFEWRTSDLREFVVSELGHRITRPVVLVVDALDECSEADVRMVVELLEELSARATRAGTTVRICLSSRHYPTINMNRKLESTLDNKKGHQEDIASYVQEKLESKDEKLRRGLEEKSNSVFLWAILVVAILNKASYAGRIEEMAETLASLPGDLEAVFDKMLGRDDANQPETVLMLQLVLFSPRPLTLEELFFGVTAETAPQLSGPWDPDRITSQIIERRITSSSRGLIEVREGGDGPEAQFIHRSVNDFLHRNQRLCRLDPSLGPDPFRASHKRLWSCCWRYVERLGIIGESAKDVDDAGLCHPFLKYALSFVVYYANEALTTEGARREWRSRPRWLSLFQGRPRPASTIDDDVQLWLAGYSSWFAWWKQTMASLSIDDDNVQVDEDAEISYILAINGWQRMLKIILHNAADVNAQGGYFGNALQAAAYGGSKETVQLLLDAGADVHAQGGQYGNALQAAAASPYGGWKETVQLLLDAGADVNAQGGEYGNALQAAAASPIGRSKETVQLLLDAGADVNAQGGHFGNVLQAAAFGGSKETVQLLLDAGADVHAQGGEYGNALQAAAASPYRGSKETVQLLLDAGADVHAQGGEYGNALQAAAASPYGGSKETVQLLLDAGADVKAQGGQYGNALQAAAASPFGRSKETVQLLLDAGADVNAQGGKYGTALQAAAASPYGGSKETVQLLLDARADVHAQGGYFGNALQAAAMGGSKETVQLLLDAGADVHAQGGEYGNALQAAAASPYRGSKETVQLLLDAGADVHAQGGKYGNALQAAAYGGSEETVQLLLDAGADVHAQGGKYGNALQAAAYGGSEETVQLLLDARADVHAQGGKYGNALQAAAYGGSEETVQLLLDAGADVHAQGGKYGNALQAASSKAHHTMIRLLLESGAQPP